VLLLQLLVCIRRLLCVVSKQCVHLLQFKCSIGSVSSSQYRLQHIDVGGLSLILTLHCCSCMFMYLYMTASSLKAGGVGLNLTSASVVFLIDPWW
jgi:hypothetical protein